MYHSLISLQITKCCETEAKVRFLGQTLISRNAEIRKLPPAVILPKISFFAAILA